jgi:hypothetical protein
MNGYRKSRRFWYFSIRVIWIQTFNTINKYNCYPYFPILLTWRSGQRFAPTTSRGGSNPTRCIAHIFHFYVVKHHLHREWTFQQIMVLEEETKPMTPSVLPPHPPIVFLTIWPSFKVKVKLIQIYLNGSNVFRRETRTSIFLPVTESPAQEKIAIGPMLRVARKASHHWLMLCVGGKGGRNWVPT